jgi:hypothetical protein
MCWQIKRKAFENTAYVKQGLSDKPKMGSRDYPTKTKKLHMTVTGQRGWYCKEGKNLFLLA